ncbi:FkbM family methyltransferase [Flaviaesturariibacter amylovorans]|uniref:Methyltransferase FkbM domain-containing protein n=1 Tax=Flaviaesturariibacter amylovorans TaxID=1084520 RepID=A0ABP8GS45_9BACT
MKQAFKRFLHSRGLYEPLKYSALFRAWQRLFKPAVIAAERHEIAFYQSFVPPGALIFDIGGNDGHKTEAFLHLARTVVTCEPDAQNVHTLRVRFRNRRQRVHIEPVALGAAPGTLPLQVHHPGSAFNTLNPKFRAITEADRATRWNEEIAFTGTTDVPVTTLDALIEKYGVPTFVKIDVEGYELEVVKGLSRPIAFLSLECLFPEFRDELQESLSLLTGLDGSCTFNLSVHEKLIYPRWLSRTGLQQVLDTWTEPHFELIVRMPSAD